MVHSERDEVPRDEGMSIIELVTAMAIFTVVLSIFLAGLISMARATARSTAVVDASNSLRGSFQALDKQIRYASSINRPGVGASGAWYVEFVATNLPNGQQALCTQWRFDPTAQTLAYRTWRDDPGSTVSVWRTVGFGLTNDTAAGDVPFKFEVAGAVYAKQGLEVNLTIASAATRGGAVEADVSTAFVARNSSYDSPSNLDADADGQSDNPVCTSHLSRP
ncbi:MAG: hypothetical protein KQH57_08755 [Actinomycetales bacterium]|nr:hypothetical protein [Actinomycetales bacterium]